MTYKTAWPDDYQRRLGPRSSGPAGRRAAGWAEIARLRPSSPGQLALVGVALWLAGALLPTLHALAPLGMALLAVAGLSLLIRPRVRTMYWRGRRIDLREEPTAGERLYRLIYRTS